MQQEQEMEKQQKNTEKVEYKQYGIVKIMEVHGKQMKIINKQHMNIKT